MTVIHRTMRRAVGATMLVATSALAACSNAGAIGEALGGILGGQGQAAQLAGTIAGVDTRNRQIGIRQSDGQTVGIGYDSATRVVYQNRVYAVTNLEAGDQVVARVLDAGNGAYYTDSVHVTASVQDGGGATGGTATGNVQTLSGTVRQVDRTNGLFSLDMQGTVVTVSMPYNPTTSDANRFQNLRAGDQVRIAGVFLNNTRVELRQFY